MSFEFTNKTIDEIEKNIKDDKDGYVIKADIVIQTDKDVNQELDRMGKIFEKLISLNKEGSDIKNFKLAQTQHQIFKLFIAYIIFSLKSDNSDNKLPDNFEVILKLFIFTSDTEDIEKRHLKYIIERYIKDRLFERIFDEYMKLKIDANYTEFSKKIYDYFRYVVITNLNDYSFSSDGTMTLINPTASHALVEQAAQAAQALAAQAAQARARAAQVLQQRSSTISTRLGQQQVEFEVCSDVGLNSNVLPSDFFRNDNLLVQKKSGTTENEYYYKGRKISDPCMKKIKKNNIDNKLFNLALDELENKPTQLPGITEDDKKEIQEKITTIFDLEAFDENIKTISDRLGKFLTNITTIEKKNSYEYHLLQIESFFSALEKFEKTIDIKPFESPKKVNLDDLKASTPTEPISKEKIEKIEIKHASVNKLIEELNKKDSFKQIDEIMYGEKYEDYLTDLHKMNYNNGNVLYNSMGMPNTYSNGLYRTSLPQSLNTLSTNYNNPIEMEVLKPLIEAFSSPDINKHSGFKNFSKWLRDYPDIRSKLISYFASETSFQKLKNFSISMYTLGQDPDTSDLFKDTGYYNRDISDILNVKPTQITEFVEEVKKFETKAKERPDVTIHPELHKYFHEVLNFHSTKAIWQNDGTLDGTFKNLMT